MGVIEKPLAIQKFLRESDNTLGDLKKEPYKLSIKAGPEGRRIGFKYNQIKSDMSLRICQEARGLILDRYDWSIISCSLPKFFNAGQNEAVDIDWNTAEIFEKMDGSAIVLYHWNGEWRAHTLGTVEGEGEVRMSDAIMRRAEWDGDTFADLFWDRFDRIYGLERLEELNKGCCYMTELCTPYNRVVKRYDEDRIVLLAIRNRSNLQERDISTAADWWDRPQRFSVDAYSDIMDAIEDLDPDDEGFVCVDENWNRIKIKQESYVLRHRMKSSIVERKNGIIEAIQDGDADDFVGTFPEFQDVFEETMTELEALVDRMENDWRGFGGPSTDPDDHESRKQFALQVQNFKPGSVRGLFFQRLEGEIDDFWDGLMEMNTDSVADALSVVGDDI